MKKRHRFFYWLLRPPVIAFLKWKFGYTYEKPKQLPDHYLVISNHVTDYDMLMVGASFSRQMYFVGSEHIARWKRLYPLLRYAFAPILRHKGASAAASVLEILRCLRRGHNVCLFAEGVRSWDGRTSPILPSTAKLVKTAGCGLVTYKIKGGYFASPMWCGAKTRRGYVHGAPVHVYTPEQLKQMSDEEVYAAITGDLAEDAYAAQMENPRRYRGKRLAEGLENLLFLCPSCGAEDSFAAGGDHVHCRNCSLSFRYTEEGMLEGAPYTTVRDFADWQKQQVSALAEQEYICSVPQAELFCVESHRAECVAKGELEMTPDALRCGEMEFPLAQIGQLAMHGQRILVFMCDHHYYELVVSDGGNALKFMWFFNCYQIQLQEKVG